MTSTAYYLLMLSGFVGLVFAAAKRIEARVEAHLARLLSDAERAYQDLRGKKMDLVKEKMDLQNKALEIFILYEITKEITKSLNEKEAFEFFKSKLSEHVPFAECLYLEPDPARIKPVRRDKDYFVVPLRSKRKRIGFLAVKGALEQDREKVTILGHQFALALRRVQLYEEIERIAITDSLTDVYTRRHTLERFEEEMRRSKLRRIKMSLLMIDVDHFKRFNDKYGHLTGDQILREVGARVNQNVREIDIAGRYGGEEFCVILPDTDRQGAYYAAERIRRAVEKDAIKAYDTAVKITVSIGTATFPDDGRTLEGLIDKADWALYRSKKSGRNRVSSFGVYADEGL